MRRSCCRECTCSIQILCCNSIENSYAYRDRRYILSVQLEDRFCNFEQREIRLLNQAASLEHAAYANIFANYGALSTTILRPVLCVPHSHFLLRDVDHCRDSNTVGEIKLFLRKCQQLVKKKRY